jgi:hypothetical protein
MLQMFVISSPFMRFKGRCIFRSPADGATVDSNGNSAEGIINVFACRAPQTT